MHRYTADELMYDEDGNDRPELAEGQADSLYLEEDGLRYWVSRTGVADGEPFDNTVTVEHQNERGRWVAALIYNGDNVDEEAPAVTY